MDRKDRPSSAGSVGPVNKLMIEFYQFYAITGKSRPNRAQSLQFTEKYLIGSEHVKKFSPPDILQT